MNVIASKPNRDSTLFILTELTLCGLLPFSRYWFLIAFVGKCRSFWRKHRKKILVTTTCLGSGYLLYKLYNAHTRSLADLERELADERHNDEIIKTQLRS